MKHKFNKKIKNYYLKRGEYLYIPSNLKQSLPEYVVNSPSRTGFLYLKVNDKIERIPCDIPIKIIPTLKDLKIGFKIIYTLFDDTTEDDVRFDID